MLLDPQCCVAMPASRDRHLPTTVLELQDNRAILPVVHHAELGAAKSAQDFLNLLVRLLAGRGIGIGQGWFLRHGIAISKFCSLRLVSRNYLSIGKARRGRPNWRKRPILGRSI